MTERRIGKVISVDSFRVIVELDDIIKGAYKNGYYDLYEIAKINSYLIIPVADEKVVAMITRVKINDDTEIETISGNISLPKSKRYIIATMIGTITGSQQQQYIQGVYNFPILDNPVWNVMDNDLKVIFDYSSNLDNSQIDFNKDYFLTIGSSPVFKDFDVKINPDKFFNKHAAILGNTGSGKSCTVSTIIQSIFQNSYKYRDKNGDIKNEYITNANFIIFDTNGEYKNAFNFEDKELRDRVNAFTINNEGIKVPYWFMNYEDFDYLFKPSANTQAPILKRAISLAKEQLKLENNNTLNDYILKGIIEILEYSPDEMKKKKCYNDYGNWKYKDDNDIIKLADSIVTDSEDMIKNIKLKLKQLGECDKSDENEVMNELKVYVKEYLEEIADKKIKSSKDIDVPIFFKFDELITKYIDEAIKEQVVENNRVSEFLSTLRLRLSSFFNDERFIKHYMLNSSCDDNLLSVFIQYIFGILESNGSNDFTKYKFSKGKKEEYKNMYIPQNSQITIIDMSLLPVDILENVTGLIGRLVLEFQTRVEKAGIKRGAYPTVIVLEEAQNYIPNNDRSTERISISKRVFEKIAREGRKYGLSLIVSSQRPSELSKTILSQCNTFIVHRIQNPDDQKYIRQLVSAANEDILNQLPVLPQQHAIIMGEAVRSPIQVKLRDVNPKPNSDNPEFFNRWINKDNKLTKDKIEVVINEWLGRNKS